MWDLDAFIYPFRAFENAPGWCDQVRNSLEPPDSPLVTIGEYLLKEARSQQVNVLLSGTGADGSFGGSEYPYLQALGHAQLPFMLAYFRHQILKGGWGYATSRMLRSTIWPLLPVSLRKFLLSLKSARPRPCLLRSEFVTAIDLEGRLSKHQSAWQFRDLAKWQANLALFDAVQVFLLEAEERIYSKYGIEQRHPFFDRRLIEYAIAVPDFQHLKNGQRKRLILEGSKKLIPEGLQKSTNYGHFSNVFQEVLKIPFFSTRLASMEISRLGWVSQNNVESLFWEVIKKSGHTMEIHDKDYRWMVPLVAVPSMETWIREARVDVPSNHD